MGDILSRVEVGAPDACWPWRGGCTKKGYGEIRVGKKMVYAHRVAYERASGPIPEGKIILHKCDVRICCNPSHMEVGTRADNNVDMVEKGRQARGEANGQSKLTNEKVLEIKKLGAAGLSGAKIGLIFGVHRVTVWGIVSGKGWRHV